MSQIVTLRSTIHNNPKGQNLLEFLCQRFPYRNQESWTQEIKIGHVVINGMKVDPTQLLQLKDIISYTTLRHEPDVATNIETLYEDEFIWVVNKPAPLPVHGDGVFIINTLTNILRSRSNNPQLQLGHRIDRETTGVLTLSKQKEVTPKLMARFEESTCEKIYLAIVQGEVDFEEKLVQGFQGPKPGSKIPKRQILTSHPAEGYKASSTFFKLEQKLNGHSLLTCKMLSGRTNQIRTHLEYLGHPIVGDKLYGKTDEEYLNMIQHLRTGGQMKASHLLHAWKLTMNHPITNQALYFEAPIPNGYQRFFYDVK